MYLENFIQELIIEFIFRNGNESRHQISNFIVNNEIEIRKRNTKPADVTLYISEETEDQVIDHVENNTTNFVNNPDQRCNAMHLGMRKQPARVQAVTSKLKLLSAICSANAMKSAKMSL